MSDQENNSLYNRMLGNLSESDYDELRSLIFGLEPTELDKLRLWLSDAEAFADEIGSIIPLSIKQLIDKRVILPESILPLVEEAIEKSVIENPHKLANALFPIMGPAIRKAVAEDLKKMIESLNDTLEASFSPRRLGWRFQSLMSGSSYAEIVLSNALIYRVRQVFLIHRRTGLLLQHVIDEQGDFRDPDMVSAMLKAINDFVHDSFNVSEKADIETIQVGGYTVWIEPGPYAIIAGIVEGNPPHELREIFKQANEKIHLDRSKQLIHFDGDTSPFDDDYRHINMCLQRQTKSTGKGKPVIIIILAFLLLCALGYWIFISVEEKMRWNDYLQDLKPRPGIVVTETGWQDGKRFITGLRDPLAVNPASLLPVYEFDSNEIVAIWKYYYALDSGFVLQRLIRELDPPDSVRISYRNGILYIQGAAHPKWVEYAKLKSSTSWGIQQVNTGNLNANTNRRMEDLIAMIETHVFHFPYEIIDMDRDQLLKFDSLQNEINELYVITENNYQLMLHINGHTTTEGNVEGNKEFIDRRARYIKDLLKDNEIPEETLEKNIHIYDMDEIPEKIKPRSVTFDVELKEN